MLSSTSLSTLRTPGAKASRIPASRYVRMAVSQRPRACGPSVSKPMWWIVVQPLRRWRHAPSAAVSSGSKTGMNVQSIRLFSR